MLRVSFLSFAIALSACSEPSAVTTSPTTDQISQPGPSESQKDTFGILTDYVGKRFKGTPTGKGSEPRIDIQEWDWALGGSAILIRHALADGTYGGDTYVYKDKARDSLVYVYITNAGFRTEGTMTLNDDGSYAAEEDVNGHPSITKVRSTSRIQADGRSLMTSDYLDNGEWVEGHSFIYLETDEPLPKLISPE